MFGIGQCKTGTTDSCFSTCKLERDNDSLTENEEMIVAVNAIYAIA